MPEMAIEMPDISFENHFFEKNYVCNDLKKVCTN